MSSTPMLPISTPAESAAGAPSLGTILTRLYSSTRHAIHRRRPWAELLDFNSLSKPASLSDAAARIRKNFSYFRSNYLALLSAALALSLISHPFSLLILVSLLAAWISLYALRPADQPLVVWGRRFSDREILSFLLTATAMVMFLTSLGSLILSGLAIGSAIVGAHGAFRSPEVLFLDQESLGSTPFSFVSGVASSAPTAAGVVTVF